MKLQGWAVAGKSWLALIGTLVTSTLIPWFLSEVAPHLPAPWPLVIAAVFSVLTAVGVYHAPYKPAPGQGFGRTKERATPWPNS